MFNKPPRFTEIKSNLLSRTIDTFLQDNDNPQLYHWQPRQQIALDPDYVDAYYRRGLVKHHIGRYESAISDFDIFISKNPNHTDAHYHRADAYRSLDHFAEAKNDFEKALLLANQTDDKSLIELIQKSLYDIDSRTVGGAQ